MFICQPITTNMGQSVTDNSLLADNVDVQVFLAKAMTRLASSSTLARDTVTRKLPGSYRNRTHRDQLPDQENLHLQSNY